MSCRERAVSVVLAVAGVYLMGAIVVNGLALGMNAHDAVTAAVRPLVNFGARA